MAPSGGKLGAEAIVQELLLQFLPKSSSFVFLPSGIFPAVNGQCTAGLSHTREWLKQPFLSYRNNQTQTLWTLCALQRINMNRN